MKLRNKKTGVIIEPDRIAVIKNTKETDTASFNRIAANYYSLAELNDEWEDYKPAKPLIKDEKIRKAVRAWAKACDVEKCHYDGDGDFATRWHGIKLDGSQIELNEGHYSIAELCGEEEE